jgi:hypothetical protein
MAPNSLCYQAENDQFEMACRGIGEQHIGGHNVLWPMKSEERCRRLSN